MAAQLKTIQRLHSQIQQSIFTIEEVFKYDELAEQFIWLANTVRDYPGETEDWCYIGEFESCCVSDLIVGAFWHYHEWHGGQYSQSYAALCALGQVFSPGMTKGPEPDSSEETCYELLNRMAEISSAA